MNTHSSPKLQVQFTEPQPPARPGKFKVAMRELWRSPFSAKLGILIVLAYIFVAIFAP